MNKRFVSALGAVAVVAALGGAAYLLTRPKIAFVGFSDQMILTAEKAASKADIRFDKYMDETVDFTKALDAAAVAKSNTAFVVGQRLVKEMTSPLASTATRTSLVAFALIAVAAMFWIGMRRRDS